MFAKQFDVSTSTATYLGSAPTILNALTSFVWIPLSHRIGRRPVLLLGNLIAIVAAIGVANSRTFAQALGCRMVQAFFGSVGLSIGPAAISDMFFLHEKGKRMGINSILLVIGPYVGKINEKFHESLSQSQNTDHFQAALSVVPLPEAVSAGAGRYI